MAGFKFTIFNISEIFLLKIKVEVKVLMKTRISYLFNLEQYFNITPTTYLNKNNYLD